MNRRESVEELKAIWKILDEDLDQAVKYGQSDNTPYAQRALVRTFFAAVEGLSYQLRRVTLASIGHTPIFSAAEKQLLQEKRYSLDNAGKPKSGEAYLPFPQSLLFSIAMYAKNHGAVYKPDVSGNGWTSMKLAIKARNNVTHPKSVLSLSLSDQDLAAFMEASRWWHSTTLSMFAACEDANARIRNQAT